MRTKLGVGDVVMECVPLCYFWCVVSFAASHVRERRASRATFMWDITRLTNYICSSLILDLTSPRI